jgi:hypothetical protein
VRLRKQLILNAELGLGSEFHSEQEQGKECPHHQEPHFKQVMYTKKTNGLNGHPVNQSTSQKVRVQRTLQQHRPHYTVN